MIRRNTKSAKSKTSSKAETTSSSLSPDHSSPTAVFTPAKDSPKASSDFDVLLRPLPTLASFVSGWPGIASCAVSRRTAAAVVGTVDVLTEPHSKPPRVTSVLIELIKVESLPFVIGQQQDIHLEVIKKHMLYEVPNNDHSSDIPRLKGMQKDQALHRSFPFQLGIPPNIPPSVRLPDEAGIRYELKVSLVSVQTRQGSIFGRARPTVTRHASVPIEIGKHELHSTWPLYRSPLPTEIHHARICATIERNTTCLAPQDPLQLTIHLGLSPGSREPVIVKSLSAEIVQYITFTPKSLYNRHVLAQRQETDFLLNGLKLIEQLKTPIQHSSVVADAGLQQLDNASLTPGCQMVRQLKLHTPKNCSIPTITTARLLSVRYTLDVAVCLQNGKEVHFEIHDVLYSPWTHAQSRSITEAIGFDSTLCPRSNPPSTKEVRRKLSLSEDTDEVIPEVCSTTPSRRHSEPSHTTPTLTETSPADRDPVTVHLSTPRRRSSSVSVDEASVFKASHKRLTLVVSNPSPLEDAVVPSVDHDTDASCGAVEDSSLSRRLDSFASLQDLDRSLDSHHMRRLISSPAISSPGTKNIMRMTELPGMMHTEMAVRYPDRMSEPEIITPLSECGPSGTSSLPSLASCATDASGDLSPTITPEQSSRPLPVPPTLTKSQTSPDTSASAGSYAYHEQPQATMQSPWYTTLPAQPSTVAAHEANDSQNYSSMPNPLQMGMPMYMPMPMMPPYYMNMGMSPSQMQNPMPGQIPAPGQVPGQIPPSLSGQMPMLMQMPGQTPGQMHMQILMSGQMPLQMQPPMPMPTQMPIGMGMGMGMMGVLPSGMPVFFTYPPQGYPSYPVKAPDSPTITPSASTFFVPSAVSFQPMPVPFPQASPQSQTPAQNQT